MSRRASASLGSVVIGSWWVVAWLCVLAMTGCRPPPAATLGKTASPPPSGAEAEPEAEPEASPDAAAPMPDARTPPPGDPIASQTVTWTCAASLCPWGASLSGHALVWPAAARSSTTRLGYTVSAGIYLAAARANGAILWVESGTARVRAGLPGSVDHRLLATIEAGHTLHVDGLGSGEVVSVQADTPFTYRVALPPPSKRELSDARDASREVIHATRALWRCNTPDCVGGDWSGAVIAWPAWAAYQSNGRRSADQTRAVFSADGTPLYPYMGPWASGCKVTGESGTVQIIEWQRGSDAWRSTWLQPGQSHVIHLVSPEDGAMIETYEGSPGFSVSLKNCTPRRISD